jgi:hypothetical protein
LKKENGRAKKMEMGETERKREHERERGWKKVKEVGRENKRGKTMEYCGRNYRRV